MTKDMTKGPILRAIIGFSVPVWLGLLFQQLYNLADTIIVGRLLGVDALAGVGSTTGMSFFALSVASGLCNGFSVSVSQRFGQHAGSGEETAASDIRRSFGNAITLTALFSLALTVFTLFSLRPVLTLTQTPTDIYAYAHDYILVIFAGLSCTAFYNLLAANLRAIGDSRTPVLALVIASLLNIALDLLFIRIFLLGVTGAALATVLAQLVSGLFLALYIKRRVPILQVERSDLALSREISKEQLKTALPMGLEGMVISVGILIVQSAINGLGTVYVAGCTAGNKLYGIMAAPIEALCQAMVPLSGQNFGAKRFDRIDQGLRTVLLLGWGLTAVLSLFAWLCGPSLIRLFISSAETEVIRYGHRFLLFFVLGYGFLTIQMSICYTLQGCNFAGFTIFSGALETLGRIFGAVVLADLIGYTGIYLALPLAWVFTSAYLIPAYLLCRKKLHNAMKLSQNRNWEREQPLSI